MQSRLVLLVLLLTSVVAGQQYPFVHITGPNAPKGAAYLFEDSRGGLWLGGAEGGAEGLIYFDGTRFISPVKGFPKVLISGIAEDSESGIWIGSQGGLFRFFKGRLEKIADGVATQGITKVAPDLFLATVAKPSKDPLTDAELVRITRAQSHWKTETIIQSIHQTRFQLDRKGNLLYSCPGGFCELPAEDVVRWHSGLGLPIKQHPVTIHLDGGIVVRDRFGCTWMRGNLDAAYQCPGDYRETALPLNVASFAQPVILELNDGSIVVPSVGKLAIGRPNNFRVLTPANGYPSTGYSLVTKDGSIWLSNANGLFVFPSHLRMEFWTEREGLDGNTWSILPQGKKVLAIAGDAIRVLDEDRSRWRLLTELGGAAHLLPGPDNTIFAASRLTGVVQLSPTGKILRKSDPAEAMMLARTPDGQIWMTGSEISRIIPRDHRLDVRPANTPDPQDGGIDMKVDQKGALWTCYAGGLIGKHDAGWHLISKNHGLLENQCRSFAIDLRGNIWYAYYTIPAFSLIRNPWGDKPLVQHFLSGSELGNPQTNFFNSDRRGWLWRGAEDGIYVAAFEQARQGQWLRLDRTTGLPAIDANKRSFLEDQDGSVWFGAGTSAIHLFPPDDLVHPAYAPDVFVSGFSLNNGTFQMADLLDNIQSGTNLIAHVGSLQFDRRNALRLRYRVLPEQSSWKPERDLDIDLGKLHWGKHTVEVQARIFTGPWSTAAVKSFTVLKPIWASWPFLIAFGAAGSFAAAGGHRWRRKRSERAKTTLPALAEWRLAVLSPEVQSLEGALLDGRFEVRNVLARGGFATVFEGRDLQQESRVCAVKIFRHELLEKSWMSKRFQQEVSALKQIRHPNVVGIYGHGTTPTGAPYLTMEFIKGKTLRELLKQTLLDRHQTASYLRQTASALDTIHSHGVCHRDLKPENLMIRSGAARGEELVLIDFSIAIVKDPDETLHGLSRAAGTLYYMAPEQAIGYADTSSDIYSLAKVLIEMLTGQRLSSLLPDASMDLPARIRQFLAESFFGLSPASIDLIAAALEFDPSRRPKKANEFALRIAQDLDRAFPTEPRV